MKLPSFSLRSLLLVVVAIALFLPQYPFLERGRGGRELSDDVWAAFYQPVPDTGTDADPVLWLFPPDVSVKRAVWQTAAAELVAIAGWLLLKRLRARRLSSAEATP
jgi:hypothetical protein